MTTSLLITLCTILLLAYVFDLTAGKTKVPSVILLLLLGFVVRQITALFNLPTPDLQVLLPLFGTVGLILIVLEGSLELEFNRSKTPLIKQSLLVSLLPMLALAILLSFVFKAYAEVSFKVALTNAIPLCIISSAIAIPSVKSLSPFTKEFVIYESSLSDILGVLLFNFVSLHQSFGLSTFGHFGWQLLIIGLVSVLATLLLSVLLNRIEHHVKFVPIIVLVILIYALCKLYHLPGLVFILLFGLFLGNLHELKHFTWIQALKPDKLGKEVQKFKELSTEAAFLVRALFFLLFGYLMQAPELLNPYTLPWSFGIVAAILALRWLTLKLSGLPLSPLLFIAPRGLITILLFLSIDSAQRLSFVNTSLILQVILLSALLMMVGLMKLKRE